MHPEALAFLNQVLAPYREEPVRVVEFGSRDVNGSPRSLFLKADYFGIDIADGPGVDEVADAADWQSDDRYDLVISTETFEHTPRWPEIVAVARRVLVDGGMAVFTAACDPRAPHSGIDGELLPEDTTEYYGNVDPSRLKAIMAYQDFDPVLIRTDPRGDVYATGIAA